MEISQKDINFVKHMAFKYQNKCELTDLISAGLEAIVKANNNFDPSIGSSLYTYRYIRVRGAMLDCIKNVNKHLVADFPLYSGFENTNLRSDELFEDEYNWNKATNKDFVSPSIDNIEKDLGRKETLKIIHNLINSFDYQERKILKLYYYEEKTFQQISDILGISKSWVSRTHDRALKKLINCVEARVY